LSLNVTVGIDQEFERLVGAETWQRADIAYPELVREANEQTSRFLGHVAIDHLVQVEPVSNKVNATTLLAAAQLGRLGDKKSQEVVFMSAVTDLPERLLKSKNETVVRMQIIDGHLVQNGRKNAEVFGNVFLHTQLNDVMFDMSKSQLDNAYLFDALIERGVLDYYDALVVNCAPTDIDTKQKYGFFDNDAVSMQLLKKDGDEAELQTAFVAGKVAPDATRNDLKAIKIMAQNKGLDMQDVSEEEMVRFVFLVPKGSEVTTFVEQFDNANGGTFYGEAEPRQDYEAFSKMCRSRDFSAIAWGIANQLMDESINFKEPMDALRRLNKLSGKAAVLYSMDNFDIDARIFGAEAAEYVQLARHALDIGDLNGFEEMLRMALVTERSNSCPFLDVSGGFDSMGALNFECPSCKATNTRPYEGKVSNCQSCNSTAVAC
jgi:rubrerythrin